MSKFNDKRQNTARLRDKQQNCSVSTGKQVLRQPKAKTAEKLKIRKDEKRENVKRDGGVIGMNAVRP